MKKFMKWLENSFVPVMNKIIAIPWVKAVSSTMFKILPFILVGSLIFIYNVFKSYLHWLPDASPILNFSFGLLGLITTFTVACQLMEELGHTKYKNVAGLTSIATFLMMTVPQTVAKGTLYNTSLFGATGFLMGIIVALFVGIIFHLYARKHFLENSTSIPDFLAEWINFIIPIFVTLMISSILVYGFGFDFNKVLLKIFSPMYAIGDTFIGMILIIFIPTFFFSMGISSWFFYPIQLAIFLANMQLNINAVAAGGTATHIVTNEVVYSMGLLTLGGTGATLALNVLMMFSKSRRLRTLGRVTIFPSIFNINEPVIFGAPVVFNPYLMLPMWINGLTAPILMWIVMKMGLLNIPNQIMQIAQLPAPISSVLITKDFRAIIWWVVFFVMFLATWYPFFKVYEAKVVKEEQEEVEE